jgi:uncharacterized membrane protein
MNVTQKAALLNFQSNMESSEISSERAGRAREKKIDKQVAALSKQNDAANGRAGAADKQGGASAVAGGLGAAAGICMCFPPVGTIIGAVLGAVAAGIMLYGYLSTRGEEKEAAALDHSAGIDNVQVEQLDADIQEADDGRKEMRAKVQQQMQAALQTESEQQQVRRMTFS